MKLRYALFAGLLSAPFLCNAATITGTVYNMTTGLPAANQIISLGDTVQSFGVYDTTDAAGGYSLTVPTSVSAGATLVLNTQACGTTARRLVGYTGNNTIADFNVCISPAATILHGHIYMPTGQSMGVARIYLIRQQYDPILGDTALTAIDSFLTSNTGAFSRPYSTIPTGRLLLKAALLPSHPHYTTHPPAYYFHSSNSWSTATPLNNLLFAGNTETDIHFSAGVNPGGPGFIGGSVVLGANKTTGVGDPLSARILLLRNAANQPVAYTYSDANGKFRFSNIAYGTYTVSGDALGKSNPAFSVTISSSKPSVSNIVFDEHSKSFAGRYALGVNALSPRLAALSVFPNPVASALRISGIEAIRGSKQAIVHDVTGAVVSRVELGAHEAAIDVSRLVPGIYVLQLETLEGPAAFRFTR